MDELYARYINGILPLPVQVMVESHLAIHPNKKAEIAVLECVAAQSLHNENPKIDLPRTLTIETILSNPEPAIPKTVLASHATPCPIFPRPLQNLLGHNAHSLPWKPVLPGFWQYPIIKNADGSGAYMFWVKRGKAMPAHKHTGQELTLVLQGGISDDGENFRRGDIAIEYEDSQHRPIAHTDEDCICMAIFDQPLRFTQGIAKFMQRFS